MSEGTTETPSAVAKPAKVDDPTRFAVYDLRFEKFVGPVSSKRPSKAQSEKLAGHDDVEVREV